MILEDLHWADDATLAVTRYLVDHASEVPALVFGTIRTGEGRENVRALLEAAGAQVCPIGRLTQDQARDMARACAGAGGSEPSLDDTIAVVRDAEGLPLLVEDLQASRRAFAAGSLSPPSYCCGKRVGPPRAARTLAPRSRAS